MQTETLGGRAGEATAVSLRALPRLYCALGKARLSALVVVTAGVGFVVGSRGAVDLTLLGWTLLGTALLACGANGLNQWMEMDRDARMDRTRSRPLPSGQLSMQHGFLAAAVMLLTGMLLLSWFTPAWTALLGSLAALTYLVAYTPLKTRSTANTLIGAVSGAIPPVMGWTAAGGDAGAGAAILFGILFVWQIPHFLALAWIYREDYERGGYRMLPITDREGRLTAALALIYSLALIPVGLLAFATGMTGVAFAIGSALAGGWLSWLAFRFLRQRTVATARALFLATLLYLPLTLSLMVANRVVLPSEAELRGPVKAAPIRTASGRG